ILLLTSSESNGAPPQGVVDGLPFALLDVLGRPLLASILEPLLRFGLGHRDIVVVSDLRGRPASIARRIGSPCDCEETRPPDFWPRTEDRLNRLAQDGAALLLVFPLAAYTEFDLDQFIQFHLESGNRVTPLKDGEGDLYRFVISASRRSDAAFLFRNRLQ